MAFESLQGNRDVHDRLRGILEHGRLAHAWIFSGPEGVGKRSAALEFARALGGRLILVERHEDRHEILLAQIQELLRELSMSSPEARTILIDDAHRMSEEAMNALLKTLEEPPERTRILLITHVPERLLATLRSRCQPLHFAPLPEAEAADWARRELGLSEADARAAALLADGSPGLMKTLAPDLPAILERSRELQSRVLSGEINPVVEALTRIKGTEEQRAEAKRALHLLAQALRDVWRSRLGLPCVLSTPEFRERHAGLEDDEIADRLQGLVDHARLIDLNANVPLTLEDACLRL